MTTEFELSNYLIKTEGNKGFYLCEEKVKEFIRRLKEEISSTHGAGCPVLKFIDKLAGEKLK